MIKLTDLVRHDGVFLNVEAANQRGALEEIANRMVAAGIVPAADRAFVVTKLTERETLCSTAVGHGVAIPHAYFDKVKAPVVVISRLAAPVDYCSPDGEPVDLVFMLLGPERVPAQHIQILSKIVRMLKDEDFDRALREAQDPARVIDALADVETRHH